MKSISPNQQRSGGGRRALLFSCIPHGFDKMHFLFLRIHVFMLSNRIRSGWLHANQNQARAAAAAAARGLKTRTLRRDVCGILRRSGAQFIITLGKVPTGFNRANSSFLVIISVSKVSIETPLSGGQIASGNMARSEPAAQNSEPHKKYLKLEPHFLPLSSQTSPTTIRARVLFICIIPQRRCIFSQTAYPDIFFNGCSRGKDPELFSDLHERPCGYLKESARFDM